MKKYMTKEQREKLSNRLVLNFGVLLCGALVMLYVYNFIVAGYTETVINVIGIVGIICALAAIAFFVLGKTKFPKLKNYSAIFLGAFVAALITYLPKFTFISQAHYIFTHKNAVILVFILMALYYIILSIVTGIILKTHPVAPKEKNIVHSKKRKK